VILGTFFRDISWKFLSVLVLAGALAFPTWAVESKASCQSLLTKISKTDYDDWHYHHGSTAAVFGGNLAILTAAEAARILSGRPGFNLGFLTNTALDTTVTMVSHQIALRKMPKWLQKWVSEKGEFWLRSATNSVVDTGIIIVFWNMAAKAAGATIDASEVGLAFVFAATTHTFLQYTRNKLFLDLPKNIDAKAAKEFNEKAPDAFLVLQNQAKGKAKELNLSDAQAELLFLTMVDNIIVKTEFEERLTTELLSVPKVSKLRDQIQSNLSKGKDVKAKKLRRKLINHLLKLHENAEPAQAIAIEEVLRLGEPLSLSESIEFHKAMKHRHSRNKWIIGGSTVVDRIIGGFVAGGIVLRELTEQALAD
jgi:hypothetical protein